VEPAGGVLERVGWTHLDPVDREAGRADPPRQDPRRVQVQLDVPRHALVAVEVLRARVDREQDRSTS
jgi:hypothetical protein